MSLIPDLAGLVLRLGCGTIEVVKTLKLSDREYQTILAALDLAAKHDADLATEWGKIRFPMSIKAILAQAATFRELAERLSARHGG